MEVFFMSQKSIAKMLKVFCVVVAVVGAFFFFFYASYSITISWQIDQIPLTIDAEVVYKACLTWRR